MIVLVTIALVPATRLELVAPYDSGTIAVRMVAAPSTSMDQLKRIARSASQDVLGMPGVASVWCRAGGENEDTFYLADPDTSRETITHVSSHALPAAPAVRARCRGDAKALQVEGAEVSVALPRSSLAQLLGLRGSGYELSAMGLTPVQARANAMEVADRLQAAQPSASVRIAEASPVEEIRYTPRRETLSRSGVTLATVAQTTWEGLEGAVSTKLTTGGREYDVRILLARGDRADPGGPFLPAGADGERRHGGNRPGDRHPGGDLSISPREGEQAGCQHRPGR